MIARCGVLQKPINLDPTRIKSVVFACCALHNFLRSLSPQSYTPSDFLDSENRKTGDVTVGIRNSVTVNLQRSRQGNQEHAAVEIRNINVM